MTASACRKSEEACGMNILVCVKQVPDTAEIRIDPEKNETSGGG